jgi:type II secretory pathway component GspD/PulD (secretin)
MKHYFNVFAHHHIALIILLFLATLSLFLSISLSAANETDAGDELISLTVKDEPLEDVLYKVSKATGYDISLDNKWQSHLVTASLEKVSLHKGLKRILRNLNYVIIYGSDQKIKIIIYDKTASDDKSFTRRPVSNLPTPQILEKEDSSGTEEKPSENSVVSGLESETKVPASKGGKKTKHKKLE